MDAREPELVLGVAAGAALPPSVGAARVGVPVTPVVLVSPLTDGVGGSFFINRGTWNAMTPMNATARHAAMIFCFFCFALSGSIVFLAITELPSRTRWCPRGS